MDEYYLKYIRNESEIDSIIIKKGNDLFHFLKSKIFDIDRHKWKKSLYKNFVHDNNLSYCYCSRLFEGIGNEYFKDIQKGKVGFYKFIDEIKNYDSIKEKKVFNVKKDDLEGFLIDLNDLFENYFEKNHSKTEYISFIYNNFNTGYSLKTLNGLYFSAIKEKKLRPR
jgi:hypothetical protein